MAGVVFNAGTVTQFSQHFQIELGARLDPVRFHIFLVFQKEGHPLIQLALDILQRAAKFVFVHNEVDGGIHRIAVHLAQTLVGDGMQLFQAHDFVAEKLHPQAMFQISGIDIHNVAPHAERSPFKGNVIAAVMGCHELLEQAVAIHFHTHFQPDQRFPVFLGHAKPVDAGDGCHDDHVPPLHQAHGGTQAQLFDFIVDIRVLFDVDIFAGNVGFRLIIVVI